MKRLLYSLIFSIGIFIVPASIFGMELTSEKANEEAAQNAEESKPENLEPENEQGGTEVLLNKLFRREYRIHFRTENREFYFKGKLSAGGDSTLIIGDLGKNRTILSFHALEAIKSDSYKLGVNAARPKKIILKQFESDADEFSEDQLIYDTDASSITIVVTDPPSLNIYQKGKEQGITEAKAEAEMAKSTFEKYPRTWIIGCSLTALAVGGTVGYFFANKNA